MLYNVTTRVRNEYVNIRNICPCSMHRVKCGGQPNGGGRTEWRTGYDFSSCLQKSPALFFLPQELKLALEVKNSRWIDRRFCLLHVLCAQNKDIHRYLRFYHPSSVAYKVVIQAHPHNGPHSTSFCLGLKKDFALLFWIVPRPLGINTDYADLKPVMDLFHEVLTTKYSTCVYIYNIWHYILIYYA